MNLQDFNMVTNCGDKNRVVIRYGEIYHIGCFKGTYEEAVDAISKKYTGDNRDSYVCKLDSIRYTSISDNQSVDVTAYFNYAIRQASENGYLEVVKYLVSQGADISADNNCAVKWASENGYLNIVKYLVSQGADIASSDNYAVKSAIMNGHIDVVRYLISQGTDTSC